MNLTELRQIISTELAEVHTTLPGVVLAYDGITATVRPTLPKRLANGQELAAPSIVMVPVCWPCADLNGAKALFTLPLKAGDQVKLSFCERALEDWLGGSDGAPGDPRAFDLSDAFATPILRPGTMTADTENVSLQYGPMTLKITPDGEIKIDTTAKISAVTSADVYVEAGGKATVKAPEVLLDTPQTTTTGNLMIGGNLGFTAGGGGGGGPRAQIRGPVEVIDGDLTVPLHDVKAGTISLKSHRHVGRGSGNLTDPPQA